MPQDRQEQDRLLEHDYDGIQEFDNPMPRWWVWIFWATIIFSAVYAFDPRHTLRGPGRIADYQAEMAAAARRWPQPTGNVDAATLAALTHDQAALAAGKAIFTSTCAPCHRADGGGLIGPNLTDDYWLHGGTLMDIHKTITEGVLDKGMPNWGKFLKPEQINDVTVYVASLHGTNPPNPKAPQGVKVNAQ
ncbi:MAG TPA: cbb3-type cytochrome c oxidase N-terminal domain-containing protein [Gemmatimonadaceae bacterium]|jgi:cytochrome c oxidase cbb3-type subunit 3|nr:cbb3-type cytochrome c oxidase N-terminal domain-containing protein [Gemmatimonadaceae bacterium]